MQGTDLLGHTFDLIKLDKQQECYLVQYAVDGRLLDPFFEPCVNCEGMNKSEFLDYLKGQSLAMKDYMEAKA